MHASYLPRSYRPRPKRARWSGPIASFAGIFLALSLLLTACSDDEPSPEGDAPCSVENPCPDTQVCLQGVCIAREMAYCATRDDCPGGDYQCVNQVCTLPMPDAGPATDHDSQSDATDDGNQTPDTTEADGPQVVSTTPADGDEGVALDTQFTIKFSEAMDLASMNFYSLVVRDSNNFALDLDFADSIQYDDDTFTTTLTFQEPLKAAEGYKVEIRSGVRNQSGVGVNPAVTVNFSTQYEEPAKHTELAHTWAPLLYQGVDLAEGVTPNEDGDNIVNPERADADIPTRIDFDGNQSARDNLSNSMVASTPIHASIYYSVSESDQYYFLHYILYYPSRYGVDSRAEHDFAGLVVVVDKASETMLMSESVSLVATGEVTTGFKPEGSPVKVPGGNSLDRNMRSFSADELEDGTHFPLYIFAGSHQACHWYQSGHDGHCLHAPAQFTGPSTGAAPDATTPTSGVVLRPGDDGQTFEQATRNDDSGFWEMTYALVPIPTGIWAKRGNYDQAGLFELPFPYKPDGSDRPTGVGPDENLMLPKSLRSDAPSSNGRMPFSWLATPTRNNRGQWLLDPVYILENRYLFGPNTSSDYCYNFYLNIDHRDSAAHPGCAD